MGAIGGGDLRPHLVRERDLRRADRGLQLPMIRRPENPKEPKTRTILWDLTYLYADRPDICRQVCRENEVDILRGVFSSDHVHMFVSVPPKLEISDLVRKMKGRSSHRVQREFPARRRRYWGCRFWGRGYFSPTNGAITEDIVLQYLENHIADPTGISR